MISFYLVRHGETQYNLENKVQGWNDSPLTEKGQFQALCTGKGLEDTVFSKVFSGDAGRQIRTAELLMSENRRPVSIVADTHFREMCYGKYEYGSYEDMLGPLFELNDAEYAGYPGLYEFYDDIEISKLLEERDETGAFEGCERTWKRFSEGLSSIIDEGIEGNVLISTSSFAICTVLYHLFPDFKQPRLVDNTSVTLISYDGSYHLTDYNDISYRRIGEDFFEKRDHGE